ncbi:MAG: ABC transporter permease [Myxococcota bacterium]
MNLGALVSMAGREVRASKARNLISALGIAFGVGTLLVVVGLGLGARQLVLKEVVRELPVDMIEVVPKQLDLGLFKLGAGSVFGGPTMDDALVRQLEALAQVERAYPKLEVNIPLGARGGERFFKRAIYTDIFLEGVPAELLETDTGPGLTRANGYVPVVISNQLIEIFNRSVAPNLGLPALTGETLKGLPFELRFGRSVMMGTTGATSVGSEPARVSGVSAYAMPMGATVTLEDAKRILRQYGGRNDNFEYKSVILRARNAADVPVIAAAVEELGFEVDDTARRTADVMTTMTLLASSIGFLVLFLAGLNIAHSFFASLSERRRELAIFRAVGAKRNHLVVFVLAQAVIVGLVGGVLGVFGGYGARALIDAAATQWLPDFPFKPDTFFYMPAWIAGLGVLAAVSAGCLGALWPAVAAARAPVSEALSE